jgi:hypothetical protein
MGAYKQLRFHQRQADMEGIFVTVSRQALDEVLDDYHLVRANPFDAIATIIEATVTDERKKKLLEHNLELFQSRLKEAQHAH